MRETRYRIRLSVPLGQRSGTLVTRETDGRITGWLDVMKQENPFTGTLSAGGQLRLSGVIQTLVSTVHYTAAGMVSGPQILLDLKTPSGTYYHISGEELTPDD